MEIVETSKEYGAFIKQEMQKGGVAEVCMFLYKAGIKKPY